MTTFTVHVQWYPALALPLLVFTILIAVTVERLFSPRQVWHDSTLQSAQQGLDVESNVPTKYLRGTIWNVKNAVKRFEKRSQGNSRGPNLRSPSVNSFHKKHNTTGQDIETRADDIRIEELVTKVEALDSTSPIGKAQSDSPTRAPMPVRFRTVRHKPRRRTYCKVYYTGNERREHVEEVSGSKVPGGYSEQAHGRAHMVPVIQERYLEQALWRTHRVPAGQERHPSLGEERTSAPTWITVGWIMFMRGIMDLQRFLWKDRIGMMRGAEYSFRMADYNDFQVRLLEVVFRGFIFE
jgi:hypothetical protein